MTVWTNMVFPFGVDVKKPQTIAGMRRGLKRRGAVSAYSTSLIDLTRWIAVGDGSRASQCIAVSRMVLAIAAAPEFPECIQCNELAGLGVMPYAVATPQVQ